MPIIICLSAYGYHVDVFKRAFILFGELNWSIRPVFFILFRGGDHNVVRDIQKENEIHKIRSHLYLFMYHFKTVLYSNRELLHAE